MNQAVGFKCRVFLAALWGMGHAVLQCAGTALHCIALEEHGSCWAVHGNARSQMTCQAFVSIAWLALPHHRNVPISPQTFSPVAAASGCFWRLLYVPLWRCTPAEDFDDLAQRLAALAHQHRKAPLVTIACGGASTDRAHDPLAFDDDLDAASDEGSGSLVSNWDGDGRQGEGGDVAASSGVPAGSGLRSKGSRRHEDWELV